MKKRNARQFLKHLNQNSKKVLVKITLFLIGALEWKSTFEGEINSIVILAQEKLGDAILLTPLLKNLQRVLPNAEVHIITNSSIHYFFKDDTRIDYVHKGKNHYISLFKLRKNKTFDILFCTKDHPSFTFLYQSRLIRARFRVGIEHPYHRGFFNYLIPIKFNQHVIEKNCALLDYLGFEYTKEDCRPYLPGETVTENVREFAKRIFKRNCIGINLSAGGISRQWSLSKWINFLNNIDNSVVVFAMPERIDDKLHLEKTCPNVLNSPATQSVRDVGEIVRNLKVLVTPDTSLIHVASCYNTKVVGLYTSDTIQYKRFYPYLVDCRICISPTRNIEDISVEEVVTATKDMVRNGKEG